MKFSLKILLVAAATALAGGTATAAPGLAGAAPPASVDATQASGDVTLVHHTYAHSKRQWQERNWRRRHAPPPRYNYRPYRQNCYWSRYYQRTICR